MKRIALFVCAGAIFFAACNSNNKTEGTPKTDTLAPASPDGKTEKPWVPVDSATAMAKMMEYGTPGPMHAMMASWNGTWNGETTMWEYDGAAPQKSTGTAVNSMVLGGKYQSSKHTGNMMGMPFEGMGTLAYDNATKKFYSTWIDSWSTGIMSMSGDWNESTKTLTLTGTMPDILRPGSECALKENFKIIDGNTQMMEMYGPDPKTGKEFKMMEIKMTRKK